MRLTRLELLAYGPFRGVTLDFAARGVHVVFGRNEAGKSTTLRAITGFLYGIGAKTTDGHVHKLADLRIGGTVEGRDGERVRLVRRKGLSNTLLDERGQTVDENVLKRLLGGVSEETFRLAYGLDHDTLERGAKALLEGKGDLGESLFDASVGGGGEVQKLLAELATEADAIYKARASSLPLNDALKAFAEAQKTIRERQSLPEAFLRQEEALADAIDRSARANAERVELAARKQRLERARKRIPLERRRDLALERRARLGDLAAATERIEGLEDRFGAYERAFAERGAHLADAERLAEAVAEASRRAGASETDARLDVKKEQRILSLLAQRTKLAASLEVTAVDIARLDRDLDRVTVVEEATEPSVEETRLAAAAERARGLGDIEGRIAAEAAKLARKRKDLETRARALGGESLEGLLTLDVPARETVVALGKREADILRTIARLGERGSELEREGLALAKQIAASAGDFAPPDVGELTAARSARDEAWTKLQQGSGTATDVERLLRAADTLADRMIREADRVTTLARLRSEAETNQAQAERVVAELAKAEAARKALDAEVALPMPGFAETLAFLDGRAKIAETFADLVDAEGELADQRATSEAARVELGATGPLAELVAQATHRLAALEKARQRAEETRRVALEKRSQRDEKVLVKTRDEAGLADVHTKLTELLAPLGIPVEASVEEVNRAIEALRELFAVSDRRALAAANAKIADAEVRAFAADLGRALADVAPDLVSLDPRDAARTLFARGAEARENARDLADVTSRLAEIEGEVTTEDAALAADHEAAERAEDELEARLAEVEGEIARLNQEIGGVRVGLEKLQADSNAAEAAATAQQELARIRENAERWARVKLASVVLGREIERYREENQGPLLASASTLFSRLTLGAFSGVKSGFDDKDRPCLLCVRSGGAEVDTSGLSDGTRDQLYLALRLSSLLRRAEVTEPMPLVLDDVLIQLDDERASAALAVLAEVSSRMQILFFTHHARLVDLATKAISDLVVHDLNVASASLSASALT